MTIDVLIPSYNRAHFPKLQIASLRILRERLKEHQIDLRVVISDNQSNPPVVVPEEVQPYVTIVRPPQHLPTAEENVYWGVQQCRGEYVWLLGDDDPPLIENAVNILKAIRDERPDYVSANCSGSLVNGHLLPARTICSNAASITSLPDFVARTGLTFVMAGLSCIICKRERLAANLPVFTYYFEKSKIYSLVFWLLDCFWDGSFRFFNEPLVIYKQNESDVKGHHWVRTAIKQSVFHRYFWTLGIARLARGLQARRPVPVGYFARILEQNWEDRYHALSNFMMVFLDQVSEDLTRSAKSEGRSMTSQEREEFLEFVTSEDPRLLEAIAPLVAAAEPTALAVTVSRDALEKLSREFYSSFFVESSVGWNIYRFDGCYRALPARYQWDLPQELADIAPLSSDYQVVSNSLADVKAQVAQRPFVQRRGVTLSGRLSRSELAVIQKWARMLNRLKRMFPSWLKERLGH